MSLQTTAQNADPLENRCVRLGACWLPQTEPMYSKFVITISTKPRFLFLFLHRLPHAGHSSFLVDFNTTLRLQNRRQHQQHKPFRSDLIDPNLEQKIDPRMLSGILGICKRQEVTPFFRSEHYTSELSRWRAEICHCPQRSNKNLSHVRGGRSRYLDGLSKLG